MPHEPGSPESPVLVPYRWPIYFRLVAVVLGVVGMIFGHGEVSWLAWLYYSALVALPIAGLHHKKRSAQLIAITLDYTLGAFVLGFSIVCVKIGLLYGNYFQTGRYCFYWFIELPMLAFGIISMAELLYLLRLLPDLDKGTAAIGVIIFLLCMCFGMTLAMPM